MRHWIQDTVPALLDDIERASKVARSGDIRRGIELLKDSADLSDKLFLADNVTSAHIRIQMAELYLIIGDSDTALKICRIVLKSIPSDDIRYVTLKGYSEYVHGIALAIRGDIIGAIESLRASYSMLSLIMLKSMPNKVYRVASSLSVLLAVSGKIREAIEMEKIAQQCADSCLACGKISMNEWVSVVANRIVVLLANSDRSSVLSVGRAALTKYEASTKFVKSDNKQEKKLSRVAETLESCNGGVLGIVGSLFVRMAVMEISTDMSNPSDAFVEVQKFIKLIKALYNTEKENSLASYTQLLQCCLNRARRLLSRVYERLMDAGSSSATLEEAYRSSVKHTNVANLENVQVLNALQRSPPPFLFRCLMLTERVDSLLLADIRLYFGIPTSVPLHDLCFGITRDILMKFGFDSKKLSVSENNMKNIEKVFYEQRTVSSQTRAKSGTIRNSSSLEERRSLINSIRSGKGNREISKEESGKITNKQIYQSGLSSNTNNKTNTSIYTAPTAIFNINTGNSASVSKQKINKNNLSGRKSVMTRSTLLRSSLNGNQGTEGGLMLSTLIKPSEYLTPKTRSSSRANYCISDYEALCPINTNTSLARSARNEYADRQKQLEEEEKKSAMKPFQSIVRTQYELMEIRKVPTTGSFSKIQRGDMSSVGTKEGGEDVGTSYVPRQTMQGSLHMTQLNAKPSNNEDDGSNNYNKDLFGQGKSLLTGDANGVFDSDIVDIGDDIVTRSKIVLNNLRKSLKMK